MIAVRMMVLYWAFTKSFPTSASADDAITLRRMTEAGWSGPFGVGATSGGFETSGGHSLKYKFPPEILWAWVSDTYEVSLWMYITFVLVLYLIHASEYVSHEWRS